MERLFRDNSENNAYLIHFKDDDSKYFLTMSFYGGDGADSTFPISFTLYGMDYLDVDGGLLENDDFKIELSKAIHDCLSLVFTGDLDFDFCLLGLTAEEIEEKSCNASRLPF